MSNQSQLDVVVPVGGGLAISDVATLERSCIQWNGEKQVWKALVRRLKTGKQVFLPIPDELKATLDALPLPRG